MTEHKAVSLKTIESARARLASTIVRTPLISLNGPEVPCKIFVKLENLQPVGSFKMRGAGNAILALETDRLSHGVWTASAGNMAHGVAWYARVLGLPCKVVVPDDAPETKTAAIQGLGARIFRVPFVDYQAIQRNHACEFMEGTLIHPFGDEAVMAGNGTIGLEILEELPDVEAVIIPFGGGGLSCGIASAIRALRPHVKLYAAEVDTGAPLAASLAAGKPVETEFAPSFVSGIGGPCVFPEMWSLASQLLDGSLIVTLSQVAEAIRILCRSGHVVAEGAGAVALAAALSGKVSAGKVVCIVSGGNIDTGKLIQILQEKDSISSSPAARIPCS
ncbi:MAG TPA: pyridoxal-phosphate dependent enzyme [Spirochaetia bacterium]|nr:pyridoxal-phosphate dependent enzyme [Spirochaetia bacterium]